MIVGTSDVSPCANASQAGLLFRKKIFNSAPGRFFRVVEHDGYTIFGDHGWEGAVGPLNRNGKLLCEIDRTCGVDGTDGKRLGLGREDPPDDCGAGGEYDGVGCKIASEYDGRIVSKDFIETASSAESLLVNSSCMPGLAWDIDREGRGGWLELGGERRRLFWSGGWPARPVIKDIDSGCGWSTLRTL
jgi:hypothetical protein